MKSKRKYDLCWYVSMPDTKNTIGELNDMCTTKQIEKMANSKRKVICLKRFAKNNPLLESKKYSSI